ncbi:Aminotransferase, variant 2 [Balamuthia mandrillaris]
MYANTHTGTSITGLQTSLFRSEARMIIERAINAHNKAGTDKDILVFTGSGATGAITKLVQILGLTRTTHTVVETEDRPVVFVGPYEHHSNLLPWRESICEVVEIEESNDGTGAMDLADLERKLVQYTDRKLKMGSFSAASNVTGILTDTNKVSALLHKYGALAFWDYASAAPYVKIDMNPVVPGPEGHLVHKDAIFISPHKFIGGVATPGILVAKKRLFSNKVPSCPGGGTVFFVTDKDHRYVKERVEREEGGTPDIVGSIRAALTFQLKEAIGTQAIQHLENKYCEMAMTSWKNNPNIYLLGSLNAHRLPIMSFMIVCEDRFLHYHFIAILLNDLFGIQARGGCACAGPYAQALLGIDYPLAKKLEKMLLAKDEHEFVRPGFVRLNFHYAMTEKEVQYVIDAVNFVAEHGWKFLSHYTFYPETGEWVHQHNKKFLERRWLGSITYRNGAMEYPSKHKSLGGGEATKEESFERYLNEAKLLAESISEEYSESGSSIKSRKEASQTGAKQKAIEQSLILDDEEDKLRWFMLPAEAIRRLQARNNDVSFSSVSHLLGMSPFKPNDFLDRVTELIQQQSKANKTEDEASNEAVAKGEEKTYDKQEQEAQQKEEKEDEDSGLLFLDVDADVEEQAAKREERKKRAAAAGFFKKRRKNKLQQQNGKSSIISGDSSSEPPPLFPPIPPKLLRITLKAISEFGMINEGDKVLLGLSGGKDSLSLLHTLHAISQRPDFPSFSLGACTIDPQDQSYDPSPLIDYMRTLGIPYFFESQGLIEQAKCYGPTSICSWCSRMKRGLLYSCARREGYNVLALGQHLVCVIVSFFLPFLIFFVL